MRPGEGASDQTRLAATCNTLTRFDASNPLRYGIVTPLPLPLPLPLQAKCETFARGKVRNVSHGLRRPPKRAKRAKLVSHRQLAKLFSARAVKANHLLAAVWLTATVAAMSDADARDYKKRKTGGSCPAGLLMKIYGSISSRSICRQTDRHSYRQTLCDELHHGFAY